MGTPPSAAGWAGAPPIAAMDWCVVLYDKKAIDRVQSIALKLSTLLLRVQNAGQNPSEFTTAERGVNFRQFIAGNSNANQILH